jgi:flagellar M-ring protein FliF
MERYRQQALEMWNRWLALSLARKVTYVTIVGSSLTLAGLVWWIAQPEYRALYSGLSAEESGAITTKLQAKGIPYKLAAGGTTILVPADQSMQVHLDMTNDGVAGSSKIGKGFDIFDQPMIGATPFNQHVNFLRAQQAEMARTIMQIDPIVFARVHIVRPEPTPFIREQKPTTASVMVKLRPNASLHRNTIAGIAALVAGSVEGLARENVRIIDANGRFLSEHQDSESGMLGSFMEQRKEVEQYLGGEAERLLTHVLGPGRAIVRVTAELDSKQRREKKEMILAGDKVTKTEKTTLDKTTSNTPPRAGAAGVSSNLGKGGASAGNTGGGATTSKETQQSDYEYPRVIQEWQNKHGSIERLTVAAFVDLSGTEDGDAAVSLADAREFIKKAVGFKADRDEIQVTQVRMPKGPSAGFDEEWANHERMQLILTIIRNGSIAMVALCALPILWVLWRRRSVPPPAQPEPAKLQRISEELDKNPEALAKILALWIDRSETSDKKAA